MSAPETLVLDASVGVKWFKPETGQSAALELLERAASGEFALAAPTHFVHEVLSVVQRVVSSADIVPAWELVKASGIAVVPLTDEVIAEAAAQCGALGCSFYDALAPACASLLDATVVSADRRAHAGYPRLVLI